MTVAFLSPEIASIVWRYLSCRATGWVWIMAGYTFDYMTVTDATTGGVLFGANRTFYLGDAAIHDYDGATLGVEAYACASCHTTGYKAEGHQAGKDSVVGTWAQDGVQCERCHGAGELHAADPYKTAMKVDRNSALCGECHYKGSPSTISAGSGFIKDHQQYNEIYNSKHNALQCVDCHNVHTSLHPNNPDRAAALTNKCENCHLKEVQSFASSDLPHYGDNVKCTDCHMPKAVKSGMSPGTYVGDVHTHTMVINTSATITDEPGCSGPSEGKLYTVEKHGYTEPVDIPWPNN